MTCANCHRSVCKNIKSNGSYIIELSSNGVYEIENRSHGLCKIEGRSDGSFNIHLLSNHKKQTYNEFYETEWLVAYLTIPHASDGSYQIVEIQRDDQNGEKQSPQTVTLRHGDGSSQKFKVQKNEEKHRCEYDDSNKTGCRRARAAGHITFIPSDGSASLEWPIEVLFSIKYRKPLQQQQQQQSLPLFKRVLSSFLYSLNDKKHV